LNECFLPSIGPENLYAADHFPAESSSDERKPPA
jgi:hypothetical protein